MYFVWVEETNEYGKRYMKRDYRNKHRTAAVNRCIKKGKGYVQAYPSGRIVYQNLVDGLDVA